MSLRFLVVASVLVAACAHAGDPAGPVPSPGRAKGKARVEPQFRIGDPIEDAPRAVECSSGRVAEKALDGRQVAALVEVQQHLLTEGFRYFAGGLTSPCFRSLEGYRFYVIPGSVVGVIVTESGACRQADFRRADAQILYEWSGDEPLKHVFGEPGAIRSAELSRLAAARCPSKR